MIKVCKNCGIEFNADKSVQKYCSHKCADSMNSAIRKADWKRILDYYDAHVESGMTYSKMAKELGCSTSKVSTVCKKSGREKPLTELQVQFKSLYEQGLSVSEIAQRTEKSKKNVIDSLKKLGIYKQNSTKGKRCCSRCGSKFVVPAYSNKKYCSSKCQKADSHQKNDIIRKRVKNGALVDADITLNRLFERDNGICYLCGEKCDYNDYKIVNGKKASIGKYPTIDHVRPLKNGGLHSWDNVRLAHFSCNCSKGVKNVG